MKKKENNFNLTDRLRSFRFAFRGILDLIKDEHNFRIHITVLLIVIVAGILLQISVPEWLVIILVSSLVLISESFNSSIEHLADLLKPEEDERIRKVKDIAAAAVLISAVTAVITGFIIFIPYLIKIFA
ncbi:MAG TPA: diacylglycerol kinase family protein [Bacteroidales bacterium]|nr:diacylglycerol kinase family protein [Bacteroidales bacterium]